MYRLAWIENYHFLEFFLVDLIQSFKSQFSAARAHLACLFRRPPFSIRHIWPNLKATGIHSFESSFRKQ